MGPAAYMIKLPLSWKIHDVFHESLLKEYRQPEVPKQKEQERKNVLRNDKEKEEEGEYEVDEILDSQLKKRGRNTLLEYLVKWTGYPLEEVTWEPEANLKNSEELLKDFHI